MSTRRKIFFLIPFIITGVILSFTWFDIITTDDMAIWKHYAALMLYLIIAFLLYKDRTFKTSLILTGVYLLLSTFSLLSIFTHTFSLFAITITGFRIPFWGFDTSAFLVLLLYSILNFDSLLDIYLDYKESKGEL